MIFNKHKDTPEEIVKAGLTKWYEGLSDPDKVKIKRYLKDSDASTPFDLSILIMRRANEEENYPVTVLVGENMLGSRLTDMERFDVIEEIIPAYYDLKRYDECRDRCEDGLDLIMELMDDIRSRNSGELPERIICRNYLVNVLIGAYGDYDAGDDALDRFHEMGLISEEDVNFRKQSHKIHKLQRTFDGIYGVKLKDQ